MNTLGPDHCRAYNDTCYSGLETDIANSYLNPLLQLYKYTPFFRNVSLSHVAGPCVIEDCLLCEMGFLFDMVEKAQGEICQATNFLKAYSNIPDGTSRLRGGDSEGLILDIKLQV